MKSSWINKLPALLFLALLAAGAVAHQEEASQAGEAGDDARAIELGRQFGDIIKTLRAYRPKLALEKIETAELPQPLADFLTGWAWHQRGSYERANQHFQKVEPGELGQDDYFSNRLEEFRKTAEELKSFAVYETDNFSFRYRKGPDEVMLHFLPDALERIYAQFSKIFGYTRDEKIIVELMPDHRLFSYASALTRRQIETTGTIALCVENRLAVLTPRRVAQGYYWPDVISHEFVHYIVTKQSYDNVPLWMHEGLAKYFEARWEFNELHPLEPGLEDSLARAVAADSFLTVDQMMPSFAALPTAELARQAYAQTASMMEYVAEIKGEDALLQIVKTLHDEPSLDEALKMAVDMDFEAFESSWRDWAKRQGYRTRDDVGSISVSLLDSDQPSEEALKDLEAKDKLEKKHMRLGDLLLERNRYRGALKEYKKVQQPGQKLDRQLVLRVLRCYESLGQPGRLIETIDEHVERADSDVTMLVYKAQAQVAMEAPAKAEALLERAVRINPFHPGIYQLWLAIESDQADQAKAEKLRKALEILLNPQKAERENKETKS